VWLCDREFFACGDVESFEGGYVLVIYEVFGGEVDGFGSVNCCSEDGGLGGVGGIISYDNKGQCGEF